MSGISLYVFKLTLIDNNFFQEHASKVLKLFEDIFSWLPLATVIDKRVLVAHGGISDKTDLDKINKIDRHQVNHHLVI